jgi:hypothetical protein
MNEFTSAAPTDEPAPYTDRSTGLMIFGILTFLLGCLAGLFIPLILFGQAASAKRTGNATPFSAILPGITVYGILAVALVWLGIGSAMARRWARALLLIFSWSWLMIGVFALVFMVYFVPKVMANLPTNSAAGHPAAPAAMGIVMVIVILVFGFGFVLLPSVWIFFYSGKNVKATCEARDPVIRWTDACPLPVLAMCLWLYFSVSMMLVIPLAGHGVFPFFGIFLSGAPGAIFCLVHAAVWGFAAWLLYHLDQRGWWIILIAMCVYMASSILTFWQHDISDMYRLMNYSEAQIEQVQKFGLFKGNQMNWFTLFCALPFLGYLLYIKKYLIRKS